MLSSSLHLLFTLVASPSACEPLTLLSYSFLFFVLKSLRTGIFFSLFYFVTMSMFPRLAFNSFCRGLEHTHLASASQVGGMRGLSHQSLLITVNPGRGSSCINEAAKNSLCSLGWSPIQSFPTGGIGATQQHGELVFLTEHCLPKSSPLRLPCI